MTDVEIIGGEKLMKIVQLNAVCGVGSTGVIALEISKMLTKHGVENYILHTGGNSDYHLGINYSSNFSKKLSSVKAKVFGNYGFNSHIATRKLISILDDIKPDIIHLHNIHSHDLNLDIFFKYLNQMGVRVVWTFHDCWAFTGYCTHFDLIGCDKWKTICCDCPQAKRYSLFADRSKALYIKKKELFTSIDDMTIVTPSNWLAELVHHSFLDKYRIEVINNGIDLEIFHPRESAFKREYGIDNRRMILGVPKGRLEPFRKLAEIIDKEYILVLVGLTSKERAGLPNNVIGLPRTANRMEMARLFSAADVYVNTTLQDTFPTVNIESIACGTPVITFDTGGSPEIIDYSTGMVVEKGNIEAMYRAICELCTGNDRSAVCVDRAKRLYNAKDRFEDYFKLYTRSGRFK